MCYQLQLLLPLQTLFRIPDSPTESIASSKIAGALLPYLTMIRHQEASSKEEDGHKGMFKYDTPL